MGPGDDTAGAQDTCGGACACRIAGKGSCGGARAGGLPPRGDITGGAGGRRMGGPGLPWSFPADAIGVDPHNPQGLLLYGHAPKLAELLRDGDAQDYTYTLQAV